ncbi:MAG: hypothetical protein U0359_02910 [Byssovorax sp.]
MAASQVLNQIVQAVRGNNLAGFTLDPVTQTTNADGSKTSTTALNNPADLAIKMGAWELRLLPTAPGPDNSLKIPIELVEETSGDFRSLAVEIGRLELIADPAVFIPGTLVAEPFQHIVRVTDPNARVRLFGPGFKLRFSGPDLGTFGVDVTGAEGSATPSLPSLRFDPPHFLVDGDTVGIACDEAVLDLRSDVSPPNVPAEPGTDPKTWTGLFLKELGVFINNGSQVGSGDWAGNAVLRNFFIGFDPIALSGTFRAELIHLVDDVDPQVVINLTYPASDGGTVSNSTSDITLPAPAAGSAGTRVVVEATANWDSNGDTASGSLRAHWDVPAAAHVEESYRVDRMNLGAVLFPPGSHVVTVNVDDPRLPEGQRHKTATRTINIAGVPTAGADARPLTLTADAQRTLADGNNPRQRLHINLPAGAEFKVNAVARGGSGNVDFSLTLPAGLTTATANPTGVARGTDGSATAQWSCSVSGGASPGDFVIEVSATAGTSTARHRVRGVIEAVESASAPDFDLSSYTDARPDPGVVQALVELRNGASYDDIAWTLEVQDAPADLYTSAAHDALFTDGAGGWTATGPSPTLSAGAVRCYLTESRLYRLTGTRGGATTPRNPLLISGRDLRGDELGAVQATAGLGAATTSPEAGGDDFLFPYDATTIQPTSITRQGPEDTSLRIPAADIAAAQRDALTALYREVLRDPSAVTKIHVFGQASVEGDSAYNMDLAQRRANAAKAEITGSGPLPSAAATAAGSTLSAVQAALGSIAIETHSFGEEHSHEVPVPPTGRMSVDPKDRRVFFVIERGSATTSARVRRELFVVRGDSEIIPSPVRTPSRPLQQHPFRHNVFRKATTEIELLRNRIMKFQVVLVVDLEAYNENDDDPRELNNADGITTFFLEYKENPAPAAGEPKFSWELAALADPRDKDGLVAVKSDTVRQILGGPLITVPAITALSGGEIGAGAFIAAATVGAILSGLGLITIDFLCLSGVRLRVRYGNDAGTELRFAVDYKMKYRITVDLTSHGIPVEMVTEQPIEIGFRNVGVEVREGRDVKFFYKPSEGFALDVHDPGIFQLGEGIGRLLRVDRLRLGAGSPLWFEVELAFAFETGIFSVDTLRIRVSFDGDKLFPTTGDVSLDPSGFDLSKFDISINKLGISVDVPGVLEGSGMLEMTNDAGTTTVAGEAEVEVVPLKFGVSAGAKFISRSAPTPLTAFYGTLGVTFSPGLPIGTTGIALQGLEGLLGVNMGRTQKDPEQALAWYMLPPIGVTSVDKWAADDGRWAVGAGAVLGTAYDAGFTFNLKGIFLFELPGPKFTLAANANLITLPPSLSDPGSQGTLSAIIMLDFENQVFLIGLDFRYKIDHLLDFHVPVEAYFNLQNARDWHIRFGQWEPASKRISLRILDLWTASGYLQIEGDRLQNSKLDLIGPAIGLGSRVEINWGAKPVVWFEAYLEWHVGIQLSPFLAMGSIDLGGSLHLGPFSIGARGTLTVRAPDPLLITGEVCGSIDLWLFSIEGCASITIGGGDPSPPPPASPFSDLTIVDRWTDRALNSVKDGSTVVNDVPIDALLNLNFTSDVRDERGAPASSVFIDAWRNQVSSELFYEFGLSALTVIKTGGTALSGFDQTWPGLSLPDKTGPAGNEAKAHRTLRLFSWLPSTHARAVDFSAGYADTLWTNLQGLCDPTPPPSLRCVTMDEAPLGYRALWELDACPLSRSFVINSRATGLGAESLQSKLGLYPARVVPLPAITWDGQAAKQKALELGPGWPRVTLSALFPDASYPPARPVISGTKLDLSRWLARDRIQKLTEPILPKAAADLDIAAPLRPVAAPTVAPPPAAPPPAAPPPEVATGPHIVIRRPVDPGLRVGPHIDPSVLAPRPARPPVDVVPAAPVTPVTPVTPEAPVAIAPPLSANINEALRLDDDTLEALVAQPFLLDERSSLFTLAAQSPVLQAFTAPHIEGAALMDTLRDLNTGKKATTPLSARSSANVLGFYLGGLLWVAVDALTDATALFLVPDKVADGEVLFFDEHLAPVGFIHRLPTAPAIHTSPLAGYKVVAVRETLTPDPSRRHGIRWMVILPPSRAVTGAAPERNLEVAARVAPRLALGPSYFLQLCGHTWDDWKRWHDKEEDRLRSLQVLQHAGGLGGANPGGLDGQLLDPDSEYTVQATMVWRRYPSATGAENGSGSFGSVTLGRFHTAKEAPADLGEYIAGREPASDDQPHYPGESLRVDFRTRSVDKIWEKFGKQLVIRAKADLGGEVFLQPVASSGSPGFVPVGSPEWSWNQAMSGGIVPCLLNTTIKTGGTVTTAEELSPNTGYTVTVHARPLGEAGTVADAAAWDARLQEDIVRDGAPDGAKNRMVYRFALRTSRYKNFAEHLQSYRDAAVLDLVVDGQGALPSASARSDAAVDALCQQLAGGPMELPRGSEVVRVWRATPSTEPYGTPTFTLLGVLIDGPEPVLRVRSDGSARVSVQAAAGATFSASAVLPAVQIAGQRGARVFVLCSPSSSTTALTLRFTDIGPASPDPSATPPPPHLEDLVIPVGASPLAYQE